MAFTTTVEPVLYRDCDPKVLERVTEAVGTRMAASVAMSAPQLARDDAISPACLRAGIVRAHLIGAVSAVSALWQPNADSAAPQGLLYAALAEAIQTVGSAA